jgi:hypothetical protein
MLIKSSLLTQASGSVGGLTAAHNQGGIYLRGRTIPVNPASAQQVAVRNFLSQLTTAWGSALTAAQRAAWQTYADNVPMANRLGDMRPIGAIAHYVRSNVPRLQAGLARVDDAPTVFDLGSFGTVTLTGTADDPYALSVDFDDTDDWMNETGSAMLVYASREKAPTINFHKGPYRYAGAIEGDDSSPPSSPAAIDSQFAGTADNVAFGYVLVTRADGRLSPVSRFRCVLA